MFANISTHMSRHMPVGTSASMWQAMSMWRAMSTHLSVHTFVHTPIHISVRMAIHMPIHMSIHMYIHMYMHMAMIIAIPQPDEHDEYGIGVITNEVTGTDAARDRARSKGQAFAFPKGLAHPATR